MGMACDPSWFPDKLELYLFCYGALSFESQLFEYILDF